MDRLNNARTPSEAADAKGAADGWLTIHPGDSDVRTARERLEADYGEDPELEKGSPT